MVPANTWHVLRPGSIRGLSHMFISLAQVEDVGKYFVCGVGGSVLRYHPLEGTSDMCQSSTAALAAGGEVSNQVRAEKWVLGWSWSKRELLK